MKKVFFLLTIPFLLFSCGKKSNFSITGRLIGGAGEKIYFNKLLLNSEEPLDSAVMDKDGKFEFNGNTSSPAFYLLKISTGNFATLLIDSAENCIVTGPIKNFSEKYEVTGSTGSEHMRELNLRFTSAKRQIDSLTTVSHGIKSNPLQFQKISEIESTIKWIKADHTHFVTSFVKKNPFSLASVYALYQKWDDQNYVVNDLQAMKISASALFSIYPKNEQVIALYQNALEIVRNESNKRLNAALMENAVNSPNIILPDADGKEKALWSLHGKYVLLHFWSAKDRPSLIMNPVLSEIHQKYKNRGFEIYMVSIDTDREAWMEAIQDYNLNCINVGDMKGCYQAVTSYNIRELPSNYLLDKEGVIIGKDLKGPALDQTLNKIFN